MKCREKWGTELMRLQIEQATGKEVEDFRFDRSKFFELSNLKAEGEQFHSAYLLDNITPASIAYLQSCLPPNSLFICYELSPQTQELLDKSGITFINYWNHPVHYLDDLFFAWNTNNEKIHQKLLQYKIDERLFFLYANYFKIKLMWNADDTNNPLREHSALFIGQSMRDKSIERDGKFLNITDFKDRIIALKDEYQKLYYAPHPKNPFNTEVSDFIKEHPDFIEVVDGINTYQLLANPRVEKVIGISSSTLYEATYFGKQVEYLFKPFYKFGDEFDFRNNLIGVYNDNYSVSFWQNILSPVMNVSSAKDLTYLSFTNRARDLSPESHYWGYNNLDKVQDFIGTQNVINSQMMYHMREITNMLGSVMQVCKRCGNA